MRTADFQQSHGHRQARPRPLGRGSVSAGIDALAIFSRSGTYRLSAGSRLANYADLESCAGDGEIAGEALTEALAGRLLSREIPLFGCRPCGLKGKATSTVALIASGGRTRRGRRTRARQETPGARTGRLRRRLLRNGRPVGEGASRTPHAYGAEESDRAVVPAKGPNKGGQPPAEDLEGRARTEENVVGRDTDRTQWRTGRVPGAGRCAERRLL